MNELRSETAAPTNKPRLSRVLPAVARVLLGLPLVLFGLNAFLNFIPPPDAPLPERAMAFVTALVNSGYMFPLIGATQLCVGLLLVCNRFVPLALVLIAPFFVHAIVFHAVLERSGLGMLALFVALEGYLAWVHRAAFRPLLSAHASSV
jgi:hypothetical protein